MATSTTPSEMLGVIADPQRWRLLEHLVESDRRVGELVALTGRPQNLVSYHLGALRTVGLVTSRRSAADGRDTYYRVDLDRFGEVIGAAASALHPGLRLVTAEPPTRLPSGSRPRLLFLCTGNSARSQIAEALAIHHSGGAVEAHSAGSHPKPLHPNAVRVLAERGIDIAGRRTTSLDSYARSRFDRVVTLCDKVREICPELPGAPPAIHWSMADPAASGPDDEATYPAFVATAEEIDARVRLLLAQLATPPKESDRAHR